jgi:glycosyltransferase involved in cell wall biosynthesis
VKIALVHDYLNQRGGAERVFAQFVRAWPDAPVYTALYDERMTGDLVPSSRVRTSYLARMPGVNRYFRFLAPLYPRVFEAFDLSAYDTIVSSTSSWAKGVRIAPGAVHICYTSTVSRFAFAYDQYVGGFGLRTIARPVVNRLIAWDKAASALPTHYVANSHTVAERIRRYYHRDAEVLHPPIDIDRFAIGRGAGDYFFIASRLLPYKRVDLAIRAAQLAGVKLIVAGTGPSEGALRDLARGTTTTMLGFVDDHMISTLMGDAIAAILPGEEDFGLVPLEAAAAGRPTIAFRAGGARETVVEGVTGAFFDEQTPGALAQALRSFEPTRYDVRVVREHAEAFGPERFIEGLKAIVERVRSGSR